MRRADMFSAWLQGWKGFQFNHLVRRTDLLYRDLWMLRNGSAAGSGEGMWMPSFWVRSRFEAPDSGAAALKFAIKVGVDNAMDSIHEVGSSGLHPQGFLELHHIHSLGSPVIQLLSWLQMGEMPSFRGPACTTWCAITI